MEILIPILGILCGCGIAPVIIYLRGRHKLEERRLELEARSGSSSSETKRLTEENKLLRERVENLESIVCSVDFELNQKLAKVIDEHRSMVLPPAQPTPAPSSSQPQATPPELDRTATAHGAKASVTNTSLEPGQVLAGRYRV